MKAALSTRLKNVTGLTISIKQVYADRLFDRKWTLKELAEKVRIFNAAKNKNFLACRRIVADFLDAAHIHEIRIPGVGSGGFESAMQAERNGPMIPGPRSHLIELDWEKPQLNILKRQETRHCFSCSRWAVEHVIPLIKIKKIKIGRVPVGLRHLEIELHKN